MDNVCHTLVGAVLGDAGLKQRSRLASATLMIAANIPDIDVAVYATSIPPVSFRRGWTHGLLAQVLLPPVLAWLMWMWSRRRPADQPSRLGWLVALAYLGVFSHVGLDYLNNYGVRLLMPWSGRWFYGDTLFILDPWMWTVLGVGVWLARRRRSVGPARTAVALASVYVIAMLVSAQAARQFVLDAWTAAHGSAPVALMVGPSPVTPLTREVIVDAGDHYERGTFSWLPASVTFAEGVVPKNAQHPAVVEARRAYPVQKFLVWSRFPLWTLAPDALGTSVTVSDARFGALRRLVGRSTFSATVVVDAPNASDDPPSR